MTTPNAAGERFLCGGEFAWMEDLAWILRDAYPNRRLPTRRMPNWLARLVAVFNPGLRQTLVDLDRPQVVSNEKAKRILGWEPRSVREATLATAESLIEQGIV
jgi:dihydroflavonol-4-reductase